MVEEEEKEKNLENNTEKKEQNILTGEELIKVIAQLETNKTIVNELVKYGGKKRQRIFKLLIHI